MKLILTLVMATSFAFAGKIVPNIKWNQVERNETGSAAAMINRNNIRVESGRINYDDDAHTSSTAVGANLSISGINAEVALSKGFDSDSSTDSNEFETVGASVGKKLNDMFVIGARAEVFNTESNFGANQIGLSANYLLNENIVFGAGYSRVHTNGSDLETKEYFIGAGYINDKMAFELTLTEQPEENEGTSSIGGIKNLNISGTIFLNKFQLSPIINSSRTSFDQDGIDDEFTNTVIAVEAEFMINNQYFVGATLGAGVQEDVDNNDSSQNEEETTSFVGIMGRFKMNNLQFIARYDVTKSETEYEDGSENTDNTDKSLAFTASYFF